MPGYARVLYLKQETSYMEGARETQQEKELDNNKSIIRVRHLGEIIEIIIK